MTKPIDVQDDVIQFMREQYGQRYPAKKVTRRTMSLQSLAVKGTINSQKVRVSVNAKGYTIDYEKLGRIYAYILNALDVQVEDINIVEKDNKNFDINVTANRKKPSMFSW